MADNLGASAPQDGTLEFSGYSDAQLRDLLPHIDKARFPRNFEKLEAEIARRASSGRGRRFPVRFTAADGFAGWLQALISRQPFYGAGGIALKQDEIIIDGWQRTWLGAAHLSEASLASDRIRNVFNDQEWLSFDVQRRFWWPRHYMVRSADTDSAGALVALLPSTRSKWFDKQATDIREFYRLQRASNRRPLVTPLLVAVCVGIYLIQSIVSGYWFGIDGNTLFNWGANAGSFTVHGGWWRLIASQFLHLNPLHLVVNMWVLWNTGRLAERLFGNLGFAAIYFAAGTIGALLSIGWNPAGSSVGASGAIFGVLGSLLAYLLHGSTRIPRSVMRAHLLPTILFMCFSIFNGLSQTGIDNADHFGGLGTGLLLGWALAKPLESRPGSFRLAQSALAILLVVLSAVGLLLQVTGPASKPGPQEQFLASHGWYLAGEGRNLLRWQEIANQAGAGNIANADLEQRFEKEIIPFWRDAEPRLRGELANAPPQTRAFQQAISNFATLRLRWARAVVESAKTNNAQKALDLMQKTDVAQARLDWLSLRTQYDHRAASLAENPAVAWISNILWINYRPCARSPYIDFNQVAPSDLASDGPARRQALSCEAQRQFMARDFKGLQATLDNARRHQGDLPDGGSSYEGLTGGLHKLVAYGGLSLDAVMGRLADWRRAVPGSVDADLAEAETLVQWAYGARGEGYADSVTEQNQLIFLHRIAMADAALQALEPRAGNYAAWYSSAIDVNLLGNGKEDERRAIFDRGHARFPDDVEMYSSMLHSLMPRWGGSFEKVDKFIFEQSAQKTPGALQVEAYARLYWMYAELEGQRTDIFKDALAKPAIVSLGFASAGRHYPQSDYLLNVAGRVACQSDQRLEYLVFHNALPRRYSASVWSPGFTVESCNKKFGLKS